MAWPRLNLEEAAVMAFEPGQVVPAPETLEEIGPTAPANIVHFDIDPSNVLIGDFQDDAPEHAVQPVFKVSLRHQSKGQQEAMSTNYRLFSWATLA